MSRHNALSTMMLHQSESAPTLMEASLGKDFPTAMEQIVAKLLSKSPTNRYQNLGIVANDLAQVYKGAPVLGVVDLPKKQRKTANEPLRISRRELQLWLVATVVVAGLIGGAVGYYSACSQIEQVRAEISNAIETASGEPPKSRGTKGVGMKRPVFFETKK